MFKTFHFFDFFLLNHNVENLFPLKLSFLVGSLDCETDIDFDRPNFVLLVFVFGSISFCGVSSCLKSDSTEDDDTCCFLPGKGGFCRVEFIPRLPLGLN